MLPAQRDDGTDGRRRAASTIIHALSSIITVSIVTVGHAAGQLDARPHTAGLLAND